FDMILLVAYKILTVNSNVARNIASNIRAIYVDEFQDTRELQYNVIAKLLQNNPQIQSMFVGDIDQAIYGSLDGIAKSVEELEMLTSHTFQSKTLHGCYRSNQRLVDFYSNFQSCPYEIESRGNNKNDRGFISYDCKVTKEDLPNIIKNIIKEKIESGIHEKDICVLAPQHYPLFSLGEYLKKELPYCNFDAINISPIKVNNHSLFFKLAILYFTESGEKVRRRKLIANDILI
ncbi:TPA: UvrD-helicase domain-containing protein, partial [Enterococcus faecium]|nr:UvrD-helicase domain-containing protein [Enterococcus faecium]